MDDGLLKYEEVVDQEHMHMFVASLLADLSKPFTNPRAEWEETHVRLREILGLPSDDSSLL